MLNQKKILSVHLSDEQLKNIEKIDLLKMINLYIKDI